jgi:serine/threonine protein kinase
MAGRTNPRAGDKVIICGTKYELVQNISAQRGYQFRTWLVKDFSNQKRYVAKITEDRNKALNELRTYTYLKTERYPDRYYAEMLAFDHRAKLVRDDKPQKKTFNVILLKYLPSERFQGLDEYLKDSASEHEGAIIEKLVEKLRKRVEMLHELGVSHGDIRLANIMVEVTEGKSVTVKLIDLGLSSFGDEVAMARDKRQTERIAKRLLKRANLTD